MFSQASVSHSVHGEGVYMPGPRSLLGVCVPCPGPLLGGGYAWSQVPSGGRVYHGVGVPGRVGIPEGVGIQGLGIPGGCRWVGVPGVSVYIGPRYGWQAGGTNPT